MSKPRPIVLQLLSVAELAALLGVSVKTVRRWIDAGDLHRHHLGRQIRVSEEDAANLAAARPR